MKKCHTVLACLVVTVINVLALKGGATSAESGAHANDTSGTSVDSPLEALESAYAYTGFKEISDLIALESYSGVTAITFIDSTIPFLAGEVYGKPVWEITIDNVFLDLPRWNDEAVLECNPKDFTIVIDSAAGFFVKALSASRDRGQDHEPEPSSKKLEEFIGSNEKYLRFVGTPAPISLIQALDAAAGSNPLRSRKVVALLVEYERLGKVSVTWQITGMGFPARELFGGPKILNDDGKPIPPPKCISSSRSTVDAETGKLMSIRSPY